MHIISLQLGEFSQLNSLCNQTYFNISTSLSESPLHSLPVIIRIRLPLTSNHPNRIVFQRGDQILHLSGLSSFLYLLQIMKKIRKEQLLFSYQHKNNC